LLKLEPRLEEAGQSTTTSLRSRFQSSTQADTAGRIPGMSFLPPEHRPFVRAVVDRRLDDLPRLVYADYLEETDDPVHVARAKFIRAQVDPGTRKTEAEDYCRSLLNQHLRSWSGHLYTVLGAHVDTVRWNRGFPYWVPLTPYNIYEHGAILFEDHPLHEMQLLTSVQDEPFEFLYTEDLPTIFESGPGFVTHSFLSRLTKLQIGPHSWGMNSLRRMVGGAFRSALLTNLVALDISDNPIQDTDVVWLLAMLQRAVFADTLKELDLSYCRRITDAGANTLATAESLKDLEVLKLRGIPLGPVAMEMLHKRYGDGLIC
jgi:uncharacterized protein (TIGR02996 family)